jgi:hypothetical protein
MRGTFGLSAFRPGQQQVIESIVQQRNTIAIMPTGAGKSLCYQLPALHLPGTTIVVSPLIALMKDQADKLTELGVAVRQVNSTFSAREIAEAMAAIRNGEVDFVFATPERLERIRTSLGLNEPLIVQFITWLNKLLHGDLGTSLISNLPVMKMIGQRVEPSISIALSTIILAVIVAGVVVWRMRVPLLAKVLGQSEARINRQINRKR